MRHGSDAGRSVGGRVSAPLPEPDPDRDGNTAGYARAFPGSGAKKSASSSADHPGAAIGMAFGRRQDGLEAGAFEPDG